MIHQLSAFRICFLSHCAEHFCALSWLIASIKAICLNGLKSYVTNCKFAVFLILGWLFLCVRLARWFLRKHDNAASSFIDFKSIFYFSFFLALKFYRLTGQPATVLFIFICIRQFLIQICLIWLDLAASLVSNIGKLVSRSRRWKIEKDLTLMKCLKSDLSGFEWQFNYFY